RLDFLVLVLVVMDDEFFRDHLGGVFDEVSRELGFAHFRKMRGVGGIVAADDDEQIHRFTQKLLERVLAVLRGAANRIEETKMISDFSFAIFLNHGVLDAALDFLGFAAEHGGLIGDADGLEMLIGIEPRGVGAFEFFEEFVFVAAVQNVVTNVIGFREREDDEIMAAAIGARL